MGKLTEEQKSEAVARYVAGEGSTKLAKEYGCGSWIILDLVRAAGLRTRTVAESARTRDRSTQARPSFEPSREELTQRAMEMRLKHYEEMRAKDEPRARGPAAVRCYGWRRYHGVPVFLPESE